MNYWPMEILSFHYSLSGELWKLCKSESVWKAGNHVRWQGDWGFSAAFIMCWGRHRPGLGAGPQSASAHTPPITGLPTALQLEPRAGEGKAVIASSFLMDASIMCFKHRQHDCSQCISIKITSATHKSWIIFYDNVLLRNKVSFSGGT